MKFDPKMLRKLEAVSGPQSQTHPDITKKCLSPPLVKKIDQVHHRPAHGAKPNAPSDKCCEPICLGRFVQIESHVTWGYPNTKLVKDLVYKRGYTRSEDRKPIPLTDNTMIEERLGDCGVICVSICFRGRYRDRCTAIYFSLSICLPLTALSVFRPPSLLIPFFGLFSSTNARRFLQTEDIVHELNTCGENFDRVNEFLCAFKLGAPKSGFTREKKLLSFKKGGEYGNRGDKINTLVASMN